MSEPKFIIVKDFSGQDYHINIKHIFEILSFDTLGENRTTISYYTVPDCDDAEIFQIRTPELKESVIRRIEALKS